MPRTTVDAADIRGAFDFRQVPNNTKASWWLDAGLRWNMLHCVGICGTLFFNGYDGSLFNGLQSIDEWQEYFGHPDGKTLGLMNSAGFLPGVVASFCSDRFGNIFGRRPTVWIGTLIVIFGAVVMSLSTSVGMFCGGRVIMGFGTSFSLTMAPSHLQEIAHPRFRAQIGAFYTSIYYAAAMTSAGVCLGCLNIVGDNAWRIPCWVQIVGPGLTLLMTCTMPESPRWLAKKNKSEDALKVLAAYHANGQLDDPLVLYQHRQIMQALEEETKTSQTRYTDYLRGSGNRHRLMVLIIVAVGTNWVGNGIIAYYLSPILNDLGITEKRTQLEVNLGLAGWNLVISTTAAMLVERVGRRPLWLLSTAGMLCTMIVIMGLSSAYANTGAKAAGTAVIPFLFLFYASYDMAWTPLAYSYPVEILAFSMRTKGQAIFIAVQTLAVSVNTWVNPVALEALHWKYYSVYIAILVGLVVVIWFGFPETKGLTIEEISLVFDRNSAVSTTLGQFDPSTSDDVDEVGSIREEDAIAK